MDDRFASGLTPEELETYLSEFDEYDNVEYLAEPVKKEPVIVVDVKRVVPKPIKTVVSPAVYAERTNRMLDVRAANIAERRRQIRLIKSEYVMSGRAHELNEPVPEEILRKMIELNTHVFYIKADRAKAKLTKLIERELKRYIPHTFKVLYTQKKSTFTPHPGFMYTASGFYGSMTVFIVPDIPMVFEDPSEMEILRTKCQSHIFNMDKLAEQYHYWTRRRLTMETRLAMRLSKARTILGILDLGYVQYRTYLEAKEILTKQSKLELYDDEDPT